MSSQTSYIFIDSSAFVAWFYEKDVHHHQSIERFKWLKNNHLLPITSSYIVDETATVLSHREGQELARDFLDFIDALQVVFVTEEIRDEVYALFRRQERRGTSIADCSNIVLMKRFSVPILFTYDGDFKQHSHIEIVG